MNKKKFLIALSLLTSSLFAQEYADMSDPMAIYTNLGGSYGSNGVNLKLMKEVESNKDNGLAAIIAEIKNGYDGNSDTFTDFRLRHFSVDTTTGIGTNIDFTYNSNLDGGVMTFGKMLALPLSEDFTLYPILGGGIAYGSDSERGLEVPGALLNFTLYSKYQVTDSIWLNYNPQYYLGIYGSDDFKDSLDGTKGLYHEFAISYQINSSTNLRLWYNAEHDNFDDGEVRLEFNKQLS